MTEEPALAPSFDVAKLRRISDTIWEIPQEGGMRVPGRIIATEKLVREMDQGVYMQTQNVAHLRGIIDHAFCMPDGHWGYGFPIGGVAAVDAKEGVISPGGIGFDINCGMRLVTTNLTIHDVRPKLKQLVDQLYDAVPAGVGSSGFVKLSPAAFREIVEEGARWCLRNGFGWEEDLERTEENGNAKGADASKISERAIARGKNQIGTLGSGNHYLEIQHVRRENILDREIAKAFGLFPDQVVIMFHCGSRGFGHQVATDHLQVFTRVMPQYDIHVPDRELACAPFQSQEGQDYFAAMKGGINMSFANRQVILHRIREVFARVFGRTAEDLGVRMLYDVSHNTAKLERYPVRGQVRDVLVHRKGSTRAFGPGHEELGALFAKHGQPVIIGGSMETGSYLLVGTKTAEETTFGSTAHGSGRTMSRTKAKKTWRGEDLLRDLNARGIYVRSVSFAGAAEEAGGAYKDVDEVIEACARAGISKKVAKFVPIGNVKG